MITKIKLLFRILTKIGTVLLFTFPLLAQSTCKKVTSISSLSSEIISAGYTASRWEGANSGTNGPLGLPSVISLSNSGVFMPPGTLLSSSLAKFTTAAFRTSYGENQILFRCDLVDFDSISEIYATNSRQAYAGANETSDVKDAYHTYVKNLASRFTNVSTGEYFTARWKSRKLTADSWVQDDKYIYIPASAFSDVFVELIKTSSVVYTSPQSSNYYVYAMKNGQAFITLRGPGLQTSSIVDGTLLSSNYAGFPTYWPAIFSLYNQLTIVRGAACKVKDFPSVVSLPNISAASLKSGNYAQKEFSISLICEDGAHSSVANSTASQANVALGFLVNQATAVNSAKNLGLMNSSGGLTHLLDTNYGSSGVASGVGIQLYDESGKSLNLLSSKTTRTKNPGGWYAYNDLTTSQNDSEDGVTTYTGNFTASLEAISGETVSAGTVNAQLQVVVSFQ